MVLSVNGEERSLADGATVLTLLESLSAPSDGRGVAVAVEGEVVPRSEWAVTKLVAGGRVEVLVAVQGG